MCDSLADEGSLVTCPQLDNVACIVRFAFSPTDGSAINTARQCGSSEQEGEDCALTSDGLWACSCKEDMCNDPLNTVKFMLYVTSTTTTTTTTAAPLQCHTCSGYCDSEEDEGTLELCADGDNVCVVEFQLSADGEASSVSRKCGARLLDDSDNNNNIECELEQGLWGCSCLGNGCNNALETKKMMGYVTSTTTTTTTTTTTEESTTTTSEESTTTTEDNDDDYTTYIWITRPTMAGPPPPPPKSHYHLYVFFHYLIRILGFLIFLAGNNTGFSLVKTSHMTSILASD